MPTGVSRVYRSNQLPRVINLKEKRYQPENIHTAIRCGDFSNRKENS